MRLKNFKYLFVAVLLVLSRGISSVAFASVEIGDTVETYKIPKTVNGTRFKVSVNGTMIPTYDMKKPMNGCTLTRFAFTGLARVSVQINQGWASSAILSPKKYGIPFVRRGNTLTFTLDRPMKLVLRDPTNRAQLLLVADAPEVLPIFPGQPGVVNAATYKPDRTGVTEATGALQAAIDDTPVNGKLYIGPGTYTIGQLRLKSNFTFYLHRDALLTARLNDNPAWGAGMLQMEDVVNVTIRGRGVINGRGMYWRYNGGWYELIDAKRCSNIKLQDVSLIEPCVAFISLVNCTNTHVDNLNFIAPVDYENSDGFSLTGTGFLIENCLIWNTDATIGPTASEGVGSSNLNVRNCVLRGPLINYPSNGTEHPMTMMRDYTYENLDWPTANMAVSMWAIGGANFENHWYKNLRVESWFNWTSKLGSDFYEAYPMDSIVMVADWDPNSAANRLGYMRNINFSGFHLDSLPTKRSNVQGWDQTRNITATFNDFKVGGVLCTTPQAAGLDVKNTDKPSTIGTFANLTFTAKITPKVSIQSSSAYARRGSSPVSLKFHRSGSTAVALTVNLRCYGNAISGTDYRPLPKKVTFPAGAADVRIPVTAIGTGSPRALVVGLDNVRVADTWTLGNRYSAMITLCMGFITQSKARFDPRANF